MEEITTHGKLLDAIFSGEIDKEGLIKRLKQAGEIKKELTSEDLLGAIYATDAYISSDQAWDDPTKNISEEEYFEILVEGFNKL